jgi:hypothetical protein
MNGEISSLKFGYQPADPLKDTKRMISFIRIPVSQVGSGECTMIAYFQGMEFRKAFEKGRLLGGILGAVLQCETPIDTIKVMGEGKILQLFGG